MNTLWVIPVCMLAFAVICLAIASYNAGKRIADLEQYVITLKEKRN